ncbi:MAG: DUF1572 domain-containing protein [Flavobacterium sp.]
MNASAQLAKHLREVHFGGNWTWSNLTDNLADVSWTEANTKVYSFNTIAALTYHVNYFVLAIIKVLEGRVLDSKDKFSFDHPPIESQDDWEKLRDKSLSDAEHLALLIEQLPEQKLWEEFVESKYGNYYRNILGLIEHTHYHLGQIALIKKIVRERVQL